MFFGSRDKTVMPTREEALPGRDHRIFPVPTSLPCRLRVVGSWFSQNALRINSGDVTAGS